MPRGRHPYDFARFGGQFVAASSLFADRLCDYCGKSCLPRLTDTGSEPHLCGGSNHYEAIAKAKSIACQAFLDIPGPWVDDNRVRWLNACYTHAADTLTDPVFETQDAMRTAFEVKLRDLLRIWEGTAYA